ncbi:MAG: flavodoxin family protein [Thermoguttaceae bacterium]|nr:flavodoxin family protein [Thermoguttaceae bacterium]MBQ6620051.1 flavodoxin family protein [Thermoguttaceae bacterium]MBR2585714.1 flavodoxin family protein [Thermoguttaceae bacterium]
MKVLGVSGSPRVGGNTDAAVHHVLGALAQQGIETEFISLGQHPVKSCAACYACVEAKRCVLDDPNFDLLYSKFVESDGIILGSPVWFGSATPLMMSLIDRVGSVARRGENKLKHKVGASIAVARRAGKNFTFAQLNYFFLISEMIVPGASYWNVVSACQKGEFDRDAEGVKILDNLAENFGWLLKKIA